MSNSDSRMSGRVGYEYSYRFSMVNEDEIVSVYKLFPDPKEKSFLFEIRTNFILRRRTVDNNADSIILESERYDTRVYEDEDGLSLWMNTRKRLKDYWMAEDEIELLSEEGVKFAKQMAAKPQNSSLHLIPIAVDIDVCTVQQEGESYDECMDRAIRAQNMVPLYLWPSFTSVEERKPMTSMLMAFLRDLPRTRVEDIDKGLALMDVCFFCSKKAKVGDQISLLQCKHAFHSHCIVRWLEDNRLCPCCHSPAYESYVDYGPPFKRRRPYLLQVLLNQLLPC